MTTHNDTSALQDEDSTDLRNPLDGPDDSDDTEQAEPLSIAPDERKLVTQPYDLGVRSIREDIRTGRISLNIAYQRKYVWDSGKASRLVESLLLNVPIPVCYFAEDDGVYEVIDGLQRLTTIQRFLDDEFALNGVSVLAELNGDKFSNLVTDHRIPLARLRGRHPFGYRHGFAKRSTSGTIPEAQGNEVIPYKT
ncbi:DUF262 domain-containing protein [Cryobacterium psychrophilum]|nr:DUF262 domain-containing protein [Cryobacterium psychrophilum]